jgi:hypothetical protein
VCALFASCEAAALTDVRGANDRSTIFNIFGSAAAKVEKKIGAFSDTLKYFNIKRFYISYVP